MMKRILAFLLLAMFSMPVFAGVADDGMLSTGEYAFSLTWRSYDTPLIVNGGGAYEIGVIENGRLIVQSTSKPLQRYVSGVYDILLGDTAHLEYLNGVTQLIMLAANGAVASTADLKGGTINYIKSMQYTDMIGADPHIDIYCLPGHSWISGDPLKGVQGQWWDGSPFYIQFINDPDYDETWTNINFIYPEPATMLLLGLGGLLMRRKK